MLKVFISFDFVSFDFRSHHQFSYYFSLKKKGGLQEKKTNYKYIAHGRGFLCCFKDFVEQIM